MYRLLPLTVCFVLLACNHEQSAMEIAARKKAVEDSIQQADSIENAYCGCEFYHNIISASVVDSVMKANHLSYSDAEKILRCRDALSGNKRQH